MKKNAIYDFTFSRVYPHYITKALKKDRTKEEVDLLIEWLTGYEVNQIDSLQEKTFKELFDEAPRLNPKRIEITGSVCGVKVQDIEEPLMKNIRYLDKLIDELAKGKPLEKIMRK